MESQLTDTEFLAAIRACQLPAEHFTHEGHLRLAWLLTSENFNSDSAPLEACVLISEYATSLGAKDKFHRTITEFLQRLICYRQKQQQYKDWPQFLAANQDLVLDCLGVLDQYYERDILFGDQAKKQFVSPTKRNIED